MEVTQKKSYHLIYFLLQPFFTLLYYLKNFRKPEAKNVMWLFTVFFGFTFAIGKETQNSDMTRYIADIPLFHSMNLGFSGILAYYYASPEIDILRISLAYIVSYFTANGFYLIIVYGVIYGFFYSRNMWYILDRLKGRTKSFTRILIFCLFLVIPIWGLNGFRFWTGAHIFLFGLLPFLFEGKKKALIWCFITPFVVHYSFLAALIPLCIYLIFGNKIKLYYIFFIFSLFISSINITQFNKLVDTYAPKSFAEKSAGYRGKENVANFTSGKGRYNREKEVWYSKFFREIQKYTVAMFLLVFYWSFRKSLSSNRELLRLLSFILLFYAFANILSSLPSGGRFVVVGNLLAFSFLTLHLQNNIVNRDLYRVANIATPFLVVTIIISLRLSLYFLSLMSLIGNPITAIFSFGDNISLNDIIKGL